MENQNQNQVQPYFSTSNQKGVEGLNVKISKKFYACLKNNYSLSDLIQEGYLVYLNCSKLFNACYGVKFSSYYFKALQSHFARLKQNEVSLSSFSSLSTEEKDFEPAYEENESVGLPMSLEALTDSLKDQEYDVIYFYFFKDKTLEEIGSILSLTKERIRQIKESALEKLKLKLQSKV